jgi:hypothetical protein
MGYEDLLDRIRIPHLRELAADRIADAKTTKEAKKRVSQLLGENLVLNLNHPCVDLRGHKLPRGHEINSGQPATSWPDDTCPEVYERVLRSYTKPGDGVFHLFARSRTPKAVGETLERDVVLVDEYPSSVEDLVGMDLLEPTEEDLWQIADLVDVVSPEMLAEAFELLYLHLPMPGVVDRPRLLYGNSGAPAGTYWERMTSDQFWAGVKGVLEFWSTLLEPSRLTIRCGFARWDKTPTRMWSRAMKIAEESGWKLDHHWRLNLNPVPGPVHPDVLGEGWLLSFVRREP